MSRRPLFAVAVVLTLVLAPSSALAAPGGKGPTSDPPITGPSCSLPESNAESLLILSNYFPGYWWDHTNLTIAVQAHPSTTAGQLAAIHGAIATWSNVLLDCFDGLVTLTNVTGNALNPQRADIVLHFEPKAGGNSWSGFAICGANRCPNILVRSDEPWEDPYTDTYVGQTALHEIGHALGLGHATNLDQSTDLMGYGWPDLGEPILSQCDVEALAFIFAWAINGTAPARPGAGPYVC